MASTSKIRKYRESHPPNFVDFYRFGPLYLNGENPVHRTLMDSAWEHVKVKTGDNPSVTEANYMTAVGGQIEQAAKNAYNSEVVNLEGEYFCSMMLRQGSFFLLKALFYLGADAEHLKFEDDNIILGSNHNETDFKNSRLMFLKSMFYPGNQIPLVVLHKLMEQTFFKDIVAAKTNWERHDKDYLLSVLYDVVLAPALRGTRISEQTVDILGALYQQVVGPGGGGEQLPFLEYGTRNVSVEDIETQRIPSATDLDKLGIRFERKKGLGIREIHLKRHMCGATLYLPTCDENTLFMLRFLQDYENIQGLGSREISAYVWFLSDIVSILGDAALLESKGVIRIEHQNLSEFLICLRMLKEHAASNLRGGPTTSANLQLVRVRITQCSRRPRYSKYCGLIVILTLIGTIFAVLSYFKKDSHKA